MFQQESRNFVMPIPFSHLKWSQFLFSSYVYVCSACDLLDDFHIVADHSYVAINTVGDFQVSSRSHQSLFFRERVQLYKRILNIRPSNQPLQKIVLFYNYP